MDTKRRNVLIAAIIIGLAVIGALVYLLSPTSSNNATTGANTPPSGGAGQPTPGTLILKNMDEPTDDGDAVPLGSFLTTDQQNKIIDELQGILRLEKDRTLYEGTVVARSVHVNYDTSDITFIVQVDNPALKYTVSINTVSDVLIIKDETGKQVN